MHPALAGLVGGVILGLLLSLALFFTCTTCFQCLRQCQRRRNGPKEEEPEELSVQDVPEQEEEQKEEQHSSVELLIENENETRNDNRGTQTQAQLIQEPRENKARLMDIFRSLDSTGEVGYPNRKVNQKEEENFNLWDNARKKHIITGPLSVTSAIEMSSQRDDFIFSNTVFEAPSAFDKIWIPGQSECRIVSRERVRAIKCSKDRSTGQWTGKEMVGRFYGILSLTCVVILCTRPQWGPES